MRHGSKSQAKNFFSKRRFLLLGTLAILALFGFILSGSRTITLPGEFQILGPISWKSNVDSSSYVLNENYSRQTTNDLVFQGKVSAAEMISSEVVLVNFASQESGLQLVLGPSNEAEKMDLLLIVRTDLPIDNACLECGKPRHIVKIGSISPDEKANSFLIRIRNNPGVYVVEFNNVRKAQPLEFAPTEIDLDLSYIEVGNPSLISTKEVIALEEVKVAFSNDLRQVKIAYILFSLGLVYAAWRIVVFSGARENLNPEKLTG